MDQASLLLNKQLKGAYHSVVVLYHSLWRYFDADGGCVQGLAPRLCSRQPPCIIALPELSKNPVEGFSAGLVDDSNIFEWQVTIMGPPDTF